MEIIFGRKYRDKISGYTGRAVSVAEYMTGCNRVGLQQEVGKDGKIPDEVYFDDTRLELLPQTTTDSRKIYATLGYEIVLGYTYQDTITKVKGIAVAKATYMNGSNTILLQPVINQKDAESKEYADGWWIYGGRLVKLPAKRIVLLMEHEKNGEVKAPKGGPVSRVAYKAPNCNRSALKP